MDAVYLYMRSLMASNPFQSARESLVSLFDENRKKVSAGVHRLSESFHILSFLQYEQQERKRREAKEASSRRKEAASASTSDAARVDRRELRREIWIHPLDGRRTRRTTSTNGSAECNAQNSDDEELALLPSIEVSIVVSLFGDMALRAIISTGGSKTTRVSVCFVFSICLFRFGGHTTGRMLLLFFCGHFVTFGHHGRRDANTRNTDRESLSRVGK